MPRGRHRHSPPLHRLLPPSAIAGVSLVCAFGPWVFSQAAALRIVAAVAAATALVGAAVMRRWDTQAGKQVADLVRARTSDEWRYEERLAELESDLDESRELRVKLEHKLRTKRTELAGLRNEHAALLRRYATAETERASALEGRRLLEIEAAEPATRALPPVPADGDDEAPADVDLDLVELQEDADDDTESDDTAAVAAPVESATDAGTDAEDETEDADEESGTEAVAEKKPAASPVFSPEGSKLFLRAQAALVRLDDDTESAAPAPKDDDSAPAGPAPVEATGGPAAESEAAQEDEAEGKPEAVDGHEHSAAVPPAAKSAQPAHPSGHFTVPTAVAVVPAAPVRRPMVEGGFDFFGMQKGAASAEMDAVQNEDLADVVGQEVLAVHKAEAEAQFKPADERSRGVGAVQVIDLTAHDETEQINLPGLRSAAS
ncbi:hypothetical protein OH768_29400 [Streptomyces sp. NBC_01622]|uniref:hypothetical protein n=1 Tax=Streptomyces sp. NBC_01622 TaxID=2975903 RepID=UPI003870335D|nr:hypothetical protein OH768_29400 [Streptomyces sp. NBC_01622]